MLVLLWVDATLSDGCGIWRHLHNFTEVKCLQGLFQDFMDGFINVYDCLSPLVVEHSVVVMSTRLNLYVANFQFIFHIIQISINILLIFVLWRCLNLWWMRFGGVGQKVLFRASWNRTFFQPVFFTVKSNLN